ncbi:LacI family DNA-binding transcriptional regulator [Secundilactobacillus kimchicus]|uniref:LacI family DNA-binding transcriptional regulator n=1 Tax=Secundilactobacillus kimchicus TaxID=528209 RepID=UPI000B075652
MENRKTATMKDVAALADVSIATVSRFLNGNLDRMSSTTAAKIKDAIEKLNYVPNSAARQMITKASKMVAVVVANIDDYSQQNYLKVLAPF